MHSPLWYLAGKPKQGVVPASEAELAGDNATKESLMTSPIQKMALHETTNHNIGKNGPW